MNTSSADNHSKPLEQTNADNSSDVTLDNLLINLNAKANRCRQASLLCLACLAAFYAAQFLWAAPSAHVSDPNPQWLKLGLYIIPLALFAPGMATGKAVAYAWFCFLLMIYFCDSVITAFAIPHTLGYLGLAQSITICVLFVAAMYATKWYGLIANNGISNRKKK